MFSGDGGALATGSDDMTVKIWVVSTGYLPTPLTPSQTLSPLNVDSRSPINRQLHYRSTSLIRNRRRPQNYHKALGTRLL